MPKSMEIERKYLIRKPNFSLIASLDGYTVSEIEQIYLESIDGVTRRVRMRRYPDRVEYTENSKQRVSAMSVIETENEITAESYSLQKQMIADGYQPLYKRRHTFPFCGHTVEIDEYPQFQRTAVLEVELESEDVTPILPAMIEIIEEVTGDKRYSNHSMAKSFPPEP